MPNNGVRININAGEARKILGELGDQFRAGSSRLTRAVAAAINRTIRHQRTVVSKTLRATYYLSKADLDAAMTLELASAKKQMTGRIVWRSGLSLPLSSFDAVQTKGGVSVRVLRANRRRRIQPGGDKKILATQRRGRAAVWLAKGHVMARVEDQDHPVILYGPSFMTFFERPGVAESLRAESEEWFLKRLRHEAEAILQGIGLNNYGRDKRR